MILNPLLPRYLVKNIHPVLTIPEHVFLNKIIHPFPWIRVDYNIDFAAKTVTCIWRSGGFFRSFHNFTFEDGEACS
jgi:hypothetical protein